MTSNFKVTTNECKVFIVTSYRFKLQYLSRIAFVSFPQSWWLKSFFLSASLWPNLMVFHLGNHRSAQNKRRWDTMLKRKNMLLLLAIMKGHKTYQQVLLTTE